ncbi:hypothetical protein GSY74_02370 [Sulfurovum sp. bin170]|uniref:hypothetical protein n=1 Tax=Sulfurovum sp. bin170 TaxID=2695268 RepID=UPI0013DFAA63|nr:hypothetical protein [Sulfurovum sp. bin170]NEW60117.1 hypothetical protein [Sulfurovum sp. bin170]
MKRYVIILGLILQPYAVADTAPTDINKSIEFKDDGKSNDEVKKQFEKLTQNETILGLQVVEKKGETRAGIDHIALDTEGNEIAKSMSVKIGAVEEIAIYLDLTNVKRPVTIICGDYEETTKRVERTKLIRIPVSKIKDADKIIIKNRKGKVVKSILIKR